jgi:hypothetical protein
MTKSLGFEPSGNSRGGSKSFSMSLAFMRSKSSVEESKQKPSLSQAKLKVEMAFQDIEGAEADRLRYKIRKRPANPYLPRRRDQLQALWC